MPRAYRPKSGGKRANAGRKRGVPNRTTVECRIAAKDYGPQALEVLRRIMLDESVPAAARCTAALGLLDRAYGKARQPIDMDLKIDPESLSDAELARIIVGGSAGIYGNVIDDDDSVH